MSVSVASSIILFYKLMRLSFACRYMYSGVLKLTDENLLQEAITASDYFQMTALKEALDLKAKYHVTPSNVLSWSKVADLYSLPHLKDMCDRIQLVKLVEVIQHEEYCKLSKHEVLIYLKKCTDYSGISSDDLLQAALTWMERNEPSLELIQEIDLKKCSQNALKAVMNHSAMPQNIVETFTTVKPGKQQTMMYVTLNECIIVDNNAQMRALEGYNYDSSSSDYSYLNSYRLRHTNNGHVLIEEEIVTDSNGYDCEHMIISKYDATTKEIIKFPGTIDESGVVFSIIHKDRIYINTGSFEFERFLFYDMKDRFWSYIPWPEDTQSEDDSEWMAAVVGDDLFFINDHLELYRLDNEDLERIHEKHSNSYSKMLLFSITAVHRWLYIFAMTNNSDFKVYCYDTASGIWTDKITISGDLRTKARYGISSIMFANKIYMVGRDNLESRKLFEYNLLNDTVIESSRPCPQTEDFHLEVIDVATTMLEADKNPLRIFSE